MQTISYELLQTLKKGVNKINDKALNIIRIFLKSQITDAGVFRNRAGKSDLYYTVFGLCCSLAIGDIGLNLKKINYYIENIDTAKLDLLHLASYIRVKLLLKLLRTSNLIKKSLLLSGMNFQKILKDKKSFEILADMMKNGEKKRFPLLDENTPYSLFIYLGAAQDCGFDADKNYILKFIDQYKIKNYAWGNIKNHKIISVNSTAAAIQIKRQFNESIDNESIIYLKSQQCKNGGFLAEKNANIPDLLSTSTALFILNKLNVRPEYNSEEFIKAHWMENGGFSATVLDDLADCEYTFYGLLALGSN